MASSCFYVFVFCLFALAARSSAANCSSQSFSKNRVFALCSDLPHLNASFHWTYNASTSSLDLAFVAPPAKPAGWVAWGINPTAKGMLGTQALIAFRRSNGSTAVDTYNISAYQVGSPSPIDFAVSSKSAEHSDGVMRIFATLALPEGTTTVNHVWQVGSAVNGTTPVKHAFEPENLNAKETIDLTTGGSGAPSPAPATATALAPAPTSGGGSKSSVSSLRSHSLSLSFSAAIIIFSFAFSYPFVMRA